MEAIQIVVCNELFGWLRRMILISLGGKMFLSWFQFLAFAVALATDF